VSAEGPERAAGASDAGPAILASLAGSVLPMFGTVLFALFVWPVAIASGRGRSSRAAAG
jgi:hypothetical protein